MSFFEKDWDEKVKKNISVKFPNVMPLDLGYCCHGRTL
jgi:hypothetical protein